MNAKNAARDQSMLWGYAVEAWDRFGVWSMIAGGSLGIIALFLSLASAYVLYRVADVSQHDLVSETKAAAERIATLNNDTERLKADNLALQTVLLPRHVGLIGLDQEPPAKKWFVGIAPFAGTNLLIQVANDKEAGNLGSEIGIVVTKFGWTAQFVDERRTHFSSGQIKDGVSVSYPIGKPWSPANQNEPWFKWHDAAEALADALTKAGLAVGDRRVSRFGFDPSGREAVIGLEPNFDPPIEGVFLQVGARPVAETVEWIKQGRPDALGNPAEQKTK
jgi:hypothetical protein